MFAMGLGNAFRKDQRSEELSAASWSTPARKLRKRLGACRFLWYHPDPSPKKGCWSNSEYWIAGCLFCCYSVIFKMPLCSCPRAVCEPRWYLKQMWNKSTHGGYKLCVQSLQVVRFSFSLQESPPQLSLPRQKKVSLALSKPKLSGTGFLPFLKTSEKVLLLSLDHD